MTRPRWLTPPLIDALLIAAALSDTLFYLDAALSGDTMFYIDAPYIDPDPRISLLLGVIGALGLTLRRRWPWLSLALALPTLIIPFISVACLIALYSVAVVERRRWLTLAAGAVVFAADTRVLWGGPLNESLVTGAIYAVMTVAAPIALGLLVRTRKELTARLHDLEQVRDSERRHAEEKILATERARIAREMHDVVSHQVSLLAVQAGALQISTPDPDVKTAARTMRPLAVKTLDELRQMVTLLRAAGGQLAPQPTLEDLPDLIRDSGIPTGTSLDLPADVPAGVQRAPYRTVQEGLTNIRKHAPGADASITADTAGGVIRLTIHNTPGTTPSMNLPSAGHGLVGLRERAELLGGSLTTRQHSQQGYTLTLRVPYV